MKRLPIILLALALLAVYKISTAFGLPIEVNYQTGSYREAKSASSYIRFHMKSPDFGRIQAGFDGFVRNFSFSGVENENTVEGIVLHFRVKALDTGNAQRDKKIRALIFSGNRHPLIQVSISEPVPLGGEVILVPAQIRIGGKTHPIRLQAAVLRISGGYLVMGKSTLSMAALDVPGSWVRLARVEDRVQISFEVVVDPLTVGSR